MTDIKLTQTITPQGDNYYDINFVNGDFELTEGLETAFMMSVFCEQRDDSIDVPASRGGWAGNDLQPIQGFQQGSLLWTLYQSPATQDVATQAQQFIEDGLSWLIEDNIAQDVQVAVNIVANYKLEATITATKNNNTENVTFYDLWLATINNN